MLTAAVESLAAALGPAHGHLHACRNFVARSVGARTFVESHDDIAAQQALDLHAPFGREHVFGPVDMAAEFDALLRKLAEVGQAHHLVPSAIGQDRPLPVHECMQSAQLRNPFGTGPQHQVIGVAENDVGTGLAHGLGLHRLDRRSRTHRHEGRRADIAALHPDSPGASHTITGMDVEGKPSAHKNQNPKMTVKRVSVSVETAPSGGLLS